MNSTLKHSFRLPLRSAIRFAISGLVIIFLNGQLGFAQEGKQWVTYEGKGGQKGKHIVFLSGDEEYRSEEGLPMLARILAIHHGFKCTVLFSIDPKTGHIDPMTQTNIPGLHLLETADLVVMLLRFRELPDDQMKYIDAYTQAGKPVVALRTSTHAFKYSQNSKSAYARYSFDSKTRGWESGYGRQVLGETWVSHHGDHGNEGTRGMVNGLMERHAILRGVRDIWGVTDVYTIRDLTGDAQVLMYGQPTTGMTAETPLNVTKSAMPIAWIKNYTNEIGNTSRVFNTTMGAATDLVNEDLRRMIVNACYWALSMDAMIPEKNNVSIVGEYRPTKFGFGDHQKGLAPARFEMKK